MSSGSAGPEGTTSPVRGKSPALAAVLAWIFPGLGHLYLGWWRRGVLYAVVLLIMFVTGILLEGSLSRPSGGGGFLATLALLADAGNGLPYILALATEHGAGRAAAATHEAGNAFHWSAGIMNMLLIADAWDIATGRKARTRAQGGDGIPAA